MERRIPLTNALPLINTVVIIVTISGAMNVAVGVVWRKIVNFLNLLKQYTLDGDFTLSSGIQSTTYFDLYGLFSDPKNLKKISRKLLRSLNLTTDAFIGVSMGGIPIATSLSSESGTKLLVGRSHEKPYGLKKAIEGDLEGVQQVTIVEDVITTANSVVQVKKHVEDLGLNIIEVACIVNRGEGADYLLTYFGLHTVSLFDLRNTTWTEK